MRVLQDLASLPTGYVTTYSALGRRHGLHQRAIASIMRHNKEPDTYPCYRVVAADGRLSGYALGLPEKIRRLSADGIIMKSGRVDAGNILSEWE
ncbi:MAG TPA: MGMT family protein [bacterium]|nr:MGMT family protein [bacterium]